MANGAGGSNALGWTVLGFLAGVAATLAVLTFLSPGHARRHEQPVEATVAPPEAKSEPAVVPKPAPLKPPPVSTTAAVSATDQQVQEDAAAAGMTSRRQSSAPPPN